MGSAYELLATWENQPIQVLSIISVEFTTDWVIINTRDRRR